MLSNTQQTTRGNYVEKCCDRNLKVATKNPKQTNEHFGGKRVQQHNVITLPLLVLVRLNLWTWFQVEHVPSRLSV